MDSARSDATAARVESAGLIDEAARGRALAEAVHALADPVRTRSAGPTAVPNAADQLDSLKDLAGRLFPPAG